MNITTSRALRLGLTATTGIDHCLWHHGGCSSAATVVAAICAWVAGRAEQPARNILAAFQLLTCQRKRGEPRPAAKLLWVEECSESKRAVNPLERFTSANWERFSGAFRHAPENRGRKRQLPSENGV
jgi:hypothetical protein